jgi:hypothetical protein
VTEINRIYLSMTIETDQAPADVQLSVLAALSDRYKITNANVANAADYDDTTPVVTFVVCPVRGLLRTLVNDPDGARELAKDEGAVVVEWTCDADYRGEVTV